MSGVGFSELIILFLIGLIVLGPERLPKVANQMGTWLGQARRMTRVMKRQLEDELNLESDIRSASPYPRSRSEAMKPQTPVDRFKTPPEPEKSEPAAEADDTYSPAHAADEPGTGIDEGGDAAVPAEPDAAADAAAGPDDETAEQVKDRTP